MVHNMFMNYLSNTLESNLRGSFDRRMIATSGFCGNATILALESYYGDFSTVDAPMFPGILRMAVL